MAETGPRIRAGERVAVFADGWFATDNGKAGHALLPQLQEMGVELVEQPFPADDLESFHQLARFAHAVPIVIDRGSSNRRKLPTRRMLPLRYRAAIFFA